MFKTVSNESLVKIYLQANELGLDPSFLQLLLDEIEKRGMYDSLLEASGLTPEFWTITLLFFYFRSFLFLSLFFKRARLLDMEPLRA